MTLRAVIALALLELEDENLLAPELLDDLGRDLSVGQLVGCDDLARAIGKQKNVKLNLVARLCLKLLDVDDVTFGNLVLLATSGNDSVLTKPFIAD